MISGLADAGPVFVNRNLAVSSRQYHSFLSSHYTYQQESSPASTLFDYILPKSSACTVRPTEDSTRMLTSASLRNFASLHPDMHTSTRARTHSAFRSHTRRISTMQSCIASHCHLFRRRKLHVPHFGIPSPCQYFDDSSSVHHVITTMPIP